MSKHVKYLLQERAEMTEFLPAEMGGLCLGVIICWAWVLMTYLQRQPDLKIAPKPPPRTKAGSSKAKATAAAAAVAEAAGTPLPAPSGPLEPVANNPCGFCFPYGDLKWVTADPEDELRTGEKGDKLAPVVQGALATIDAFMKKLWEMATDDGEYGQRYFKSISRRSLSSLQQQNMYYAVSMP
jgi:hypothetical protein